jgi:2-keto-4-pentenoate hydratase/2-oxohepta-3-ene-1,7-dioic acid hydratase in catechol pathway
MKIGTCLYEDQHYVFIDDGSRLILPALSRNQDVLPGHAAWQDMLVLIQHYAQLQPVLAVAAAQAETQNSISYEHPALTYLSPVPQPRKNVMCLGLNYLEHAEETAGHVGRSAKKPPHPIVFTKATSSVTGHQAVIPYDADYCSQLDWESELGVIIGRAGRKISPENALSHIFGYTVINDLSARDLQFNHKQFFLGKSIDGGCPIGPHIVTADEIADPQNLAISCRVNGVTKQSSNTRNMLFNIAEIIATLSRSMTLEPGDIIATGTPSGVGFVREPAEFLKPGDVVECEVERIGVLRNKIGS